MSKFDEMMASPDLAVIDRAVELVEKEVFRFCCYALQHAVNYFAGDGMARSKKVKIWHLYCDQFSKSAQLSSGVPPAWWSAPYSPGNKAARIGALRRFRQMCIDAAKDGS